MADYRDAIERAMRYVAAHLDRPLTVGEVARAAHLSEFHFHRIFAAEVGEPVGRYVTRKRLEIAALRLAYEPDRSVTDIAFACGYSSPSNFSKAFSAFFGVSPSRVRRPDGEALPAALGTLARTYGASFDPRDLHVLPPDDVEERRALARELARELRFETIDAIDVACLANPEGYDLPAIERTWTDMIERVRELGIAGESIDAYGIAHDSPFVTAPERCRYHACVPCPAGLDLPAPLFRGQIPAGRYAVARHRGEAAAVDRVYRALYSVWLPESSLAPDDFTAVDRYVHDGPVDGSIDMEIWIKVRPRSAR
jgi:AraC family transcriptional regulator